MAGGRTSGDERREKLRKDFWPDEDAWTGEGEKGWFMAPRTLPLLLALMAQKNLSEDKDPTKVYLELLARHMGGGVIEMGNEAEHAFAAGYSGTRGVRTWQERMKLLEELGFIRTRRAGQEFKYVLLVHPSSVIKKLQDAGKISEEWWTAYRGRQRETKEATHEERAAARRGRKVVRLPVRPAARGTVAANTT